MSAKAKPHTSAPDPLIQAAVDELGALEKELLPFKTKISRVEMLRKQLRAAHDAKPAGEETQVHGTRFVAIVGPRGNQTVIDFAGLVKRIKAAAFAKFATCTLGSLEENVEADVARAVTSVRQTGPRSLKVLEKGSAT